MKIWSFFILIAGVCGVAEAAWAVCTLPDGVKGEIIYNDAHGLPQFCDGEKWWGMGWKNSGGGGVSGGGLAPSGAVMAFDLADCPVGWSAYAPAQGRVVRGIDPSGTVDPDGVRVAGNVQEDALQNIKGQFKGRPVHDHESGPSYGGTGAFETITEQPAVRAVTRSSVENISTTMLFDASRVARTSVETRMKNVALLYCRKD